CEARDTNEYISAHCRLRAVVQLRAELPGRAGRRGRVAVPAAPRFPERVRGAAGPGRRYVEGTLTICSFWVVSSLAMIGETERAHALCQKLLSFAGPLLLYAEEIDATTGQHLGNFPQAFTHLALIDAVSRLIEMESKEDSASATA